jgi:hypothetical protein
MFPFALVLLIAFFTGLAISPDAPQASRSGAAQGRSPIFGTMLG